MLEASHFVLVPGPTDPWSGTTLPRGSLPTSVVGPLANMDKVTLASNPCRLQFLSQEIVVFRDDLMSRLLRNTVAIKSEDDRRAEEVARKEELEDRRALERASGVPEAELSISKSSILEEYVCGRLLLFAGVSAFAWV